MIFWLAILFGALFAWIAVQIGFYGAWIMFFNLLLAAYAAVFLTPLVTASVPAATAIPDYGYTLTLMSIAIAAMFIAYGITYACLAGQLRVPFPKMLDNVGAGLLGFLAGFLILSFLAFAFSLTPLARLDICKTLGLDAPSHTTNTGYVCWWCNRFNGFVGSSHHRITSQQAVEYLLAKTNPTAPTSDAAQTTTADPAPTKPTSPDAAPAMVAPGDGVEAIKPEQTPLQNQDGGTSETPSSSEAASSGDALSSAGGGGESPGDAPFNDNPFADAEQTTPTDAAAPLSNQSSPTTAQESPFEQAATPTEKPAAAQDKPPRGKNSSAPRGGSSSAGNQSVAASSPQPNPVPSNQPTSEPIDPDRPLAGEWQTTMGARFQVEDDGKAIRFKIVRNNALLSLSGQLVRSEENPETLTGTL